MSERRSIDVVSDGHVISRIIGEGSLSALPEILEGYDEVFVVYDENVAGLIPEIPSCKGMVAIEATEEGKVMATVELICRSMMDADLSRKALVLSIGGGITTDMAGFAASIYKRGVRYANVPTTLLAMVDAAIGGKTGVNFDGFKNMLGVIRQPEFTFISAEPLRTLSTRDFLSGAAELLKTFIIDNSFGNYEKAVSLLGACGKNLAPEALQNLIFSAAQVKASIVGRDQFEGGERKKLNLGHTFAHAIEHEARLRGDDITHGEAVAMGIIKAAILSEKVFGIKGLAEAFKAEFSLCGLPVECPYPMEALKAAMAKDKKSEGGRIHFVLIRSVGKVEIVPLRIDEI